MFVTFHVFTTKNRLKIRQVTSFICLALLAYARFKGRTRIYKICKKNASTNPQSEDKDEARPYHRVTLPYDRRQTNFTQSATRQDYTLAIKNNAWCKLRKIWSVCEKFFAFFFFHKIVYRQLCSFDSSSWCGRHFLLITC